MTAHPADSADGPADPATPPDSASPARLPESETPDLGDEGVGEDDGSAVVATGVPVAAPRRLSLPPTAAGTRLDAYLAAQLPEFSRVQIKRMIDEARIRFTRAPKNGAKIKSAYAIQGGEEVEVTTPAPRSQVVAGEAIPLALLYEDAEIAVINKPAGMVVHPGAGVPGGTLANALVGRYGALAGAATDRPGIVHRLDKETSGVIVAARNEKALRNLMAQFEARTVRKLYLALVYGAPSSEFTVEAPIGRHATHRALMAIQPPGQGRGAVTHFRTLATCTEAATPATVAKNKVPASYGFVACFPKTGRTHQLRVHLKSVEHPILADGMYGPAAQFPPKPAAALIDRQALHAYAIAFDHPTTGKRLQFVAGVPADIAAVLDTWFPAKAGETAGSWRELLAHLTKTL